MNNTCHSCGHGSLQIFYQVLQIPVHSCFMVSTREEALSFPKGDLKLGFCPACGFIQNNLFQPEMHNYSVDYEETQGFSPRFRDFLSELCADQIEKYQLRGKRILEIGCGKGEFLVELCQQGQNHGIGIDPAYRPERTTSEAASRIEFIQDFYSEKYTHLTGDYVCCRHTLEHIQPVRNFLARIRRTLSNETIVFFELPDVKRVLEEQAFWDIYYEHCSYFTLGSLARLFRSCDFEILDLYTAYDDQYLMLEARPGAGENARGIDLEQDLAETAANVERFQLEIPRKLQALGEMVDSLRGRRPVVWGSGSKAVSYITTLGIQEELEFIVDINPHKQGKFLAGSGHKIVAPEILKDYRPEVIIVMNPIYCTEIQENLNELGVVAELIPL
ncbi:MAG: class I SAM-dependent methyltransferase [Planctomycetota bacterium]